MRGDDRSSPLSVHLLYLDATPSCLGLPDTRPAMELVNEGVALRVQQAVTLSASDAVLLLFGTIVAVSPYRLCTTHVLCLAHAVAVVLKT